VESQNLANFAANKAAASAWVQYNVGRYMFPGGVNIKWVAVGNEAFGSWYNVSAEDVLEWEVFTKCLLRLTGRLVWFSVYFFG
jgi:hypothetical protein